LHPRAAPERAEAGRCGTVGRLPFIAFPGAFPLLVQFIVSGALVGFIVGATGVGGGSLMTPLLTLAFGVPAQVAVGTDLLFAAITKAGGAFAYARRGQIPWGIVAWLSLGSVPASVATLVALRQWHPDPVQFSALVRPSLGFALVLTAAALAFRAQIQTLGRRATGMSAANATAVATAGDPLAAPPLPGAAEAPRPLRTMAIGAVIGVLVTLTSVGAGAIGVVALYFLYPALAARKLVGADIVHAVPLTLVAGLGHAALGTVDWRMLLGLLIGSLPAIHLGAALAGRLREGALRALLATMLLLVGGRLIWI
jgi:uncharacterized membrane protein YfcA